MDPYNPAKTEQVSVQITQPGQPMSVVTNQPGTVSITQFTTTTNVNMPRGVPRDWSTGLFGCFDDCGDCMCGLFCPMCHACNLATNMGEPCCTPCCAGLVTMRANFRGKHNLQGTIINDSCVVCWCGLCAGCQMSRELENMKNGRAAP